MTNDDDGGNGTNGTPPLDPRVWKRDDQIAKDAAAYLLRLGPPGADRGAGPEHTASRLPPGRAGRDEWITNVLPDPDGGGPAPLPHNLAAERQILGAILTDPQVLTEVKAQISGADFLLPAHREIWSAMLAVEARSGLVDILTVMDELGVRGTMSMLDGRESYLANLGHEVPTATAYPHYVQIVRDRSRRREVIKFGFETAGRAEDLRDSVDEIVFDSKGYLGRLANRTDKGSYPEASEAALAVWKEPLPIAVPTGLAALDVLLGGGMRAQSLVVLAGGTGAGKTSLALQLARNIAKRRSVVYFSTEISVRQLLARSAASSIGRPWNEIFGDDAAGPEVAESLFGLELRFVQTGADVNPMLAIDRITRQEGAAPIVFLDYLQDYARRANPEDRRLGTAHVTDELKEWATSASSVAIVVSSVARGFYAGNEDKAAAEFKGAPKESGDVEHDASALLFLDTEESQGDSTPCRLHLAKNRFGRTGTVGLLFDSASGVFRADPFGGLSEDQSEVIGAVRLGATTQDEVCKAVGGRKEDVRLIIRGLQARGLICKRAPFRLLP